MIQRHFCWNTLCTIQRESLIWRKSWERLNSFFLSKCTYYCWAIAAFTWFYSWFHAPPWFLNGHHTLLHSTVLFHQLPASSFLYNLFSLFLSLVSLYSSLIPLECYTISFSSPIFFHAFYILPLPQYDTSSFFPFSEICTQAWKFWVEKVYQNYHKRFLCLPEVEKLCVDKSQMWQSAMETDLVNKSWHTWSMWCKHPLNLLLHRGEKM